MPWKSKAQAAWGHSPAGIKALGGHSRVLEWDDASKGKKLPARLGKTRHQRTLAKLKRGMGGNTK